MATVAGTRTPAQMFALVFGAVYLLIGILGFVVTGFDGFASEIYSEKLIVFPVNPLHNLVHLAIGALWLGASSRHATAKSVNLLIGAVYALVAVLGFAGVLDFLAIKNAASADNWLHVATAVLAIYFGTAGAEGTRPATV
jgi:uncharacterized protein DUF4383